MNVLDQLKARFGCALPEGADRTAFENAVRPATDPKFGDYQANGCMALAKALRQNPASWPHEVADAVDLAPLADTPEVAGPGFLNVRLRRLAGSLGPLARSAERRVASASTAPATARDGRHRLLVAERRQADARRATSARRSSARAWRGSSQPLGHKVIRDNHLGDWGSQFGMILWGWKNARDEAAYAADPVAELARLYRLAQDRIKAGDQAVEDAARAETAKLHAGRPREPRPLGAVHAPLPAAPSGTIYDRLGVRFDVQLGESFYDPMLADVVEDLQDEGLAVESEGAIVVFVEGTKAPFIVRKQRRRLQLRARPTWRRSSTASRPGTPTRSSTSSTTARATTSSSSSPSPGSGATTGVDLRARRLRHDPGHGPPAVQDPRRGRRRPGVAARRGGRRGPQGRR